MPTTVTLHGQTPLLTVARGPLRPGFTIPELLVVLFVVSMLVYLVGPTIEVVRFRVDGVTRGAVGALVSAQRLAVRRQHDIVVAFDVANDRLRIHQDRDNDGAVDTDEPVRMVDLDNGVVFGRGQAPAMTGESGVITFTETQGSLRVVRFLRNGSASEEGLFYLTSGRSDGGGNFPEDARAVQVDRSTGRVTWYRYSPPRWIESY